MSKYFLKPYGSFFEDRSVKVDLSNYATKSGVQNAIEIHASRLAAKSDLASSKAEVDKLDIDKLVPVPDDLSKLNVAVKNDVLKKVCMLKYLPK